jgi:hypothetical protein
MPFRPAPRLEDSFKPSDLSGEYRENLCLQSGNPNTTWTKADYTTAAGSPDVLETATTAAHQFYQSLAVVAGLSYTYTVWVKPINGRWGIALRGGTGSAFIYAYFKLDDGTIGTVDAGGVATCVAAPEIGAGVYKCSLTFFAATSATPAQVIYGASANGTTTFAGDITKGFSLYQAQFRKTESANTYVPTTTAAISQDNRLQLWLDASSDSFVADSSNRVSTWKDLAGWNGENRLTYSATPSSWATKSDITCASGLDVLETATTAQHFLSQALVVPIGFTFTYTAWVKPINGRWGIALRMRDSTQQKYAYFNLTNGTLGTVEAGLTASIEPAPQFGAGVYKCEASMLFAGTGASQAFPIHSMVADGAGSLSFAGDITKGYTLYQAQFRASHTDPIYVPTTTTAVLSRSATQATDASKPVVTRGDNSENRLLNSEDITASGWTAGTNVTKTAQKILETAATGYHFFTQNIAGGIIGQTYRLIAEFKSVGGRNVAFGDNNNYIIANLTTGAVASTTGTVASSLIEDIGSSWYRVTLVTAPSATPIIQIVSCSGTTQSYAGDITKGVECRNFAVQSISASSTYIPTTTVAQYAGLNGIRSLLFDGVDDVLPAHALASIMAGNDLPITIFVVCDTNDVGGTNRAVCGFSKGSGANFPYAHFRVPQATSPYNARWIKLDNSGVAGATAQFENTAIARGATVWGVVDTGTVFNGYKNGKISGAANQSSDASTMSSIDSFAVGGTLYNGSYTAISPFSGKLGELIIFSRALSDAEIAKLSNYAMRKWRV